MCVTFEAKTKQRQRIQRIKLRKIDICIATVMLLCKYQKKIFSVVSKTEDNVLSVKLV